MTPLNLKVAVIRFAGAEPAEAKMVLVTNVSSTPKDWVIAVWWGMGRGEVNFSLATGLQVGKPRTPWRLSRDGARQIRDACSAELDLPPSCVGMGWWANAGDD